MTDDPIAAARAALDWIEGSIDLTETTVFLMVDGFTYADNFYTHLSAHNLGAFDRAVARVPWDGDSVADRYLTPEPGVIKRIGNALGGRTIVTCVTGSNTLNDGVSP